MHTTAAPLRLKPAFTLAELPTALAELEAARRKRAEHRESQWRGSGLFFFPGHNRTLVPLEQSHGSSPADWTGPHRSKSTGQDYYQHKRTKENVWRHERASKPISFRSCVPNLIRWQRGADIAEEELLTLTARAVAVTEQKPR